MNGEPQVTRKSSFIEADFTMGKGTSLLAFPRHMSLSFSRKLEPIPKFIEDIQFQSTLFLEGMERAG